MNSANVTDSAVMEKFFAAHLEFFENAKQLLSLKIFRHDPALVISHTAILVKYEAEVETLEGQRKTYILRGSTDARGDRRKAYSILRELTQKGFNDGPYIVPRPLGYFKDLGLLLYKNFPGPSLMKEFEKGEGAFGAQIGKCVDWLLKFHATDLSGLPKVGYRWQDEVKKFRALKTALTSKFGDPNRRITAAIATLTKNEPLLLRPEKFVLVHGDFQPNNVLLRGGQLAVIDFNDAFFYDELFDLVYFKIQTQFMLQRLGRKSQNEELEKSLARYLKARGIARDALTEKKIALFAAKTFLRIKVLTNHGLGSELLKDIEAYVQKTI